MTYGTKVQHKQMSLFCLFHTHFDTLVTKLREQQLGLQHS